MLSILSQEFNVVGNDANVSEVSKLSVVKHIFYVDVEKYFITKHAMLSDHMLKHGCAQVVN